LARRVGILRWTLPTLAGVLFACILLTFCFTPLAHLLLRDADTGWHIINGRQILASHAIPRVDDFSFTHRGQPWFAWEWLFDLAAGALHSWRGLGAVAALGALLVAATFALLFRLLVRRGAPVPFALVLTLLAFAASVVHLHARPHLVTWLLVVVWLDVLDRAQQNGSRVLWSLPALTVLWVNTHGGWLLGIALLFLYLIAAAWPGRPWRGSFSLAWILLACVAATFANPYGAQLHLHVARYLGDSYLMSNIQEFASPNFHDGSARAFLALLLLAIAAFAYGRPRTVDVLLALFSVWLGVTAARNLPLAAIILCVAMAPALGRALRDVATASGRAAQIAARLKRSSENICAVEARLAGVLLPAIAIAAVATALTAHRSELRNLRFDSRFPAAAADFLAAHNAESVFSTDQWSAYLIYRLYPRTRVAFDDRHDFYGAEFAREYVRTLEAQPGWEKLMNESGTEYVVLPPAATLSTLLRQRPEWRLAFQDNMSVVFRRLGGSAPAGSGN